MPFSPTRAWRSGDTILWRITCKLNLSKAPPSSATTGWLFATAENSDRFQAEPERYAPQYGGYCAYAVSKGRTASIDPEAWRVVDGKLYLNYSKGVQKKWEQDVTGNVSKADKELARFAQVISAELGTCRSGGTPYDAGL